MVAHIGVKLIDGVNAGNVSAIRELQKYIERNDLMLYGQTQRPAPTAKPLKATKLGKKEEAVIAAHNPDAGTPMGELMMRRQQSTH